jgi:protein PhnA
MNKELEQRSNGVCELCTTSVGLTSFVVAPKAGTNADECIYICSVCKSQLTDDSPVDSNHWRCLNDSIWSEVNAVKVVSYRMLNQLKSEGWPNDLLEMMYMDEETQKWANEGVSEGAQKHVDSNGVELQTGDSIVLIKDLKVKGGNFTAKRGTAVRNIRLVHDNHEHIEGKVEGQTIVILTQYVKK